MRAATRAPVWKTLDIDMVNMLVIVRYGSLEEFLGGSV